MEWFFIAEDFIPLGLGLEWDRVDFTASSL